MADDAELDLSQFDIKYINVAPLLLSRTFVEKCFQIEAMLSGNDDIHIILFKDKDNNTRIYFGNSYWQYNASKLFFSMVNHFDDRRPIEEFNEFFSYPDFPIDEKEAYRYICDIVKVVKITKSMLEDNVDKLDHLQIDKVWSDLCATENIKKVNTKIIQRKKINNTDIIYTNDVGSKCKNCFLNICGW